MKLLKNAFVSNCVCWLIFDKKKIDVNTYNFFCLHTQQNKMVNGFENIKLAPINIVDRLITDLRMLRLVK